MKNQIKCALFNETSHIPDCTYSEDAEEYENHCFTLFESLNNQNFTVKQKGCLPPQLICPEKNVINKNHLFCCCQGEMCNQNLTPESCLLKNPNLYSKNKYKAESYLPILASHFKLKSLIILIIVPLLVLLLSYLLYKIYKKRKMHILEPNNFRDKKSLKRQKGCRKPLLEDTFIDLEEYKANGRYGNVYRAKMYSKSDSIFNKNSAKKSEYKVVAVKIFELKDRESFKKEFEIYNLPEIKHENILNFIKAEEKLSDITNNVEYWLVTEYHAYGSLTDYLKIHLLTYFQAIQMCADIAKGLSHLHGYGSNSLNRQIAHRDFKSNNVLLKSDLTACIADFGLAFVFYDYKPISEALGQVGTPRYMAPEVLDGAIQFFGDFLLKIDIYSCALVLWEILSRCEECNDEFENTYMLPFEKELGSWPSIKELKEYVSDKKMRPVIPNRWRVHSGLDMLARTITDCWEHDADSRLTAPAIVERIKPLFNHWK